MSLPPLRIPHQRQEVVEDLGTRLGRAYERLGAWKEGEASKQFETAFKAQIAWQERMDRIKHAAWEKDRDPTEAELADTKAKVEECKQRIKDIEEITRALNYEMGQAKQEAGHHPCLIRKPTKTLEEWDVELIEC